jgi:hypothetical protein
MLALVPFIPVLYGFEESSAWGIAAISALVVMAVFLPGIAMRTKRMRRYQGFGARRNAFNFGLGAVEAEPVSVPIGGGNFRLRCDRRLG